ncbi:tudor domain-containing protein 15 [Toxotes jaculatrix]|uniref:tudor domain-containing protein 15 n=1 Tax=Toxotes jaculatrix TaxID=941984 RepID=UPI001B3ACB1C|nr:tudor domain-containing protein 15 [Toxotes jaculatrix]
MTVTDAAAMQSVLGSKRQRSQNSGPSAPCALWPVDLKLTHLDWNPEATLIHFQGQYLTICELDYNILQGEIQNVPKTKAEVDIGEFCLVEDLASARWYRGRVQNRKEGLFDVFLIDHGNVLSVDVNHISSCSNDLFILPSKIVCGFLANVLLLQSCHSVVEEYLSNLIGRNVTGYIQALLPHKVLLLEAPDINSDLVRHGFGRHVDTDTFLLLVEMLTEVPLKPNIEPVPDLLIEKPRGQEFCFRPSSLQAYEEILSFCQPRLSCGTHAKVRVTAAVNPGLFFCQMVSMETDLWEMSTKLAKASEHKTEEFKQTTPENLGLLCSVKGKDGKWYRGFVQFLPINSRVRVLFIDYGFFESVNVENIHRLPPDLSSAPIMALPCSLSSLSHQDEAVKTQQMSLLKAGLLGGLLDMEISSFDEEQHLYSITLIGAEDNDVKEPEPISELPRREAESVFQTEELSPQGGYSYCETVMGKALEAEEAQVDSVFVGYVEYVQNPSHFWIRTQKRKDEFEEMMTKMADHFSQVKLDEDVLVNPKLGTMCCAVYEEDMNFYRGVVTDTLEHGAEVLFIDFGNTGKVPHMLIKNIPEAFASKSAFAFCCALANVFPLDEVWTSATCDFFRKIVSNKVLLVRVVHRRKNKFVVDLYEMGSDSNQSITDLLISSKQVGYWNNISSEPVVKDNTGVTEETRCPRSSVTPDISGDAEQLECEEEDNTCKNEIKEAQAPASFRALRIKPGYEFAVHCSYISSPSDFWCQPQDKVPALEELMDKIQQYYSANTVPLQSGVSCCVAKSPVDGKWHRAIITEKQNGHARVMLVDCGFTIKIKEHNLQAILPEYVYLEGQAFRCSFSNLIEPTDSKNCGDWSPEVCNLMKDFVFNSSRGLRCKVVSQLNVQNKGLCNVVDLYNTQTQQTITGWLVEQGLAREATVLTKQLSAALPESFVYSSYDLSPGNEEQVYVTHVSSQWEVYCHLARNTEIIEELEEKILEESEKMMKASARTVVRKLCLAKYLDGKWYRGLAHPVQSPLHLSVFFVDYGNTNISEKTHVMFLPRDSADLLYTPMQAVRCCLASVSKKELYADVKEWLDRAVLNKQVKAVILQKSEDGSFIVELFDGDVNINEKVKDLIFSLSPKPKIIVSFDTSSRKTEHRTHHTGNTNTSFKCRSQPEWEASNSPSLNCWRSTRVGNAPQKKKNKKEYVDGEAQDKNTKLKQQNEDKTKSCVLIKPWKNSQVKQQREYLDKKTKSEQPQKTNGTEIPLLSCLPAKKISAGLRANCFVSHINSVNSFYLQLSEDEPAILKMCEDLNSGIFRNSLKATTSLRTNDLVLAEYEEDGALYRSVVKDYEGSSRFRVEFVDYGNSAVVGRENICLIPKEYLTQPRFSISCSLLDTGACENDASFTDAVMEKPLMVDFVRQYGTHWEVKVEILDEAVDPPAALQAAVENSPVNQKEKEVPASSAEIEEKVRSCEQTYLRPEMSESEITESEQTVPPVKGENVMLKTPCVTLSTKLKVKTCRSRRRRLTANKSDSKRSQRTSTFSVCILAETQNAAADVKPSLYSSPSQKLAFAPVDIDKVYFGLAAAVTTPFEFCVVLEDLLLIMNKVSIILDDLPGQMSPLPEAHLIHGTCCLVKSDSKNKWCRSEIVHADTTVVLNLVDYGHYECIPYKDCSKLKRLPEELVKLPKVTYPCILRGVKPVGVDEQWTDEAAVFFQQCLYQKNLQIFFREFVANTHWKVDILTDGLHVAKELVDAGLANYIDVTLGLRFQEQIPCEAPPEGPDTEEECGQEDEEVSDGKSHLSNGATDEAEEKMPLSSSSMCSHCFLI